ncbi:MAG: site-2 protease family protein [Planctomycetota bacterium]|jgi:Zn-dependent protease|nr:site-2 protease family protein [Planctomycetota bacterium]
MLAALEVEDLTIAFGFYVVFLLSVTAHEAAHALAALKLGDRTAYLGGQVTLDPIPHIRREPVGMVGLPIVTLLLVQWPLGFAHAPYDPVWAAWYPKRAALMALAGPGANLVLGAVAFVIMKVGLTMGAFEIGLETASSFPWAELVRGTGSPVANSLAIFSSLLLVQNLLLFIFNLFPIPPMDGSAALPLVIPEGPMHKVRALFAEPWAPFVGLIVAWNLFPEVFYPAFRSVMKLLVS